MRRLRKLVSILTALALCLGMLPATAAAAPADTADTWDGTADTSWYDADETEFTITTAAQLAGLTQIVNGTADGITQDEFSGKTVTLGADIDLNGSETNQWTPIGNTVNCFSGAFDGRGHTISELYINTTANYQGLFGHVGSGGRVENLFMSGSVTGGECVGGVVGFVDSGGAVENCYNTGNISATGNNASVAA